MKNQFIFGTNHFGGALLPILTYDCSGTIKVLHSSIPINTRAKKLRKTNKGWQ